MNRIHSFLSSKMLQMMLIGTAYAVAAKLCLKLAFVHPSATPVWAPTGIALAAFLCLDYGVWPAIALGALFANYTTAGSLASSVGIAVGNTLEGLVGAYLVKRFAGGRTAFQQPRNIIRFVVLAACGSTLISASIGVTSLAVMGYAPWHRWGPIALTWWLGDMGGALIAAPLLVLWSGQNRIRWNSARRVESAALAGLTTFTGIAVFSTLIFPAPTHYSLEFICLAPLIWTALRFSPREAATAAVILCGTALWGTLQGSGPFADASPNQSLLLLQTYMGVATVLSLLLSSVTTERREIEDALRKNRDLLGRRVIEHEQSLAQKIRELQDAVIHRQSAEDQIRRYQAAMNTVQDRPDNQPDGEKSFQDIMNSRVLGLMHLDAAGRLLRANGALLSLLGYPESDQPTGLDLSHILPETAKNQAAWILNRLSAHAASPPMELDMLRNDGTRVTVLLGIIPLAAPADQALGFVVDLSSLQSGPSHR
jgi:integral membrane sensor domain MASE1